MPVHRTSIITDTELYSWAKEHLNFYWSKTFDEVLHELIASYNRLESVEKITHRNK
jgi:hypothetical protein